MSDTTTRSRTIVLDDTNFDAEVIKSDRPVMVDFWADWCPPCRVLAPTIEELASEFGDSVKIGKLDVENNPDAAVRFGISSIPTVLVFKNGQIVDTLIGAQPKPFYERALNQALDRS